MSLTVEKCLQAWTNSLKQLNAKADIVFFGDSLIYYGDFASVFPNKVVCNLGLRGDTLQGMIERIEQVRIVRPSIVYLMAGVNNVSSCSVDEFKSLYEVLLRHLQMELPDVDIVVQSLLPVNDVDFSISCNNMQIRSCNEAISKIADFYKLKYVDLFSLYVEDGKMPRGLTLDGLHLKKDAYKKWIEVLTRMN